MDRKLLHTPYTLPWLVPLCRANPYFLFNLYFWQYFSCAIMIVVGLLFLLFDLLMNSLDNLWVE